MITITQEIFDYLAENNLYVGAGSSAPVNVGHRFELNDEVRLYVTDSKTMSIKTAYYFWNNGSSKSTFVGGNAARTWVKKNVGREWRNGGYFEVEVTSTPDIFVYDSTMDDVVSDARCVFLINGEVVNVGAGAQAGDVLAIEPQTVDVEITQAIYFDSGSASGHYFRDNGSGVFELTVESDFRTGGELRLTTVAAEPEHFLFTDEMLSKVTGNGCSMQVNGVVIDGETKLFEDDDLTLVANPNRQIIEASFSEISWGGWGGKSYKFEISEPIGGNVATLTVGDWVGDDLKFEIEVEIVAVEVTGNNNIYLVDREIIKSVNAERFEWVGVIGSESPLDYGDYILSLTKIPFKIDPELISGEAFIVLGDKTTKTQSPVLLTDHYRVDLGYIEVPAGDTPSLDYMRTTCNVTLPFANSIAVEPEYVLGERLGVEYLIDLYTGKTTINLKSSKVGGSVFHSATVDLGVSIPYIRTELQSVNASNIGISLGGNNHITHAGVELQRHRALLPYGFFAVPVTDDGILGDEKGYIEVENIDLRVNALSVEKEQILNVLRNGVIIK